MGSNGAIGGGTAAATMRGWRERRREGREGWAAIGRLSERAAAAPVEWPGDSHTGCGGRDGGSGHLVCIAFDIKKVPHLHKTHFLEWAGAAVEEQAEEAAGE